MTHETLRIRIADGDNLTDLELTAESDDCRKLPQTPSWVERVGEVIDDFVGAFLGKEMPRE